MPSGALDIFFSYFPNLCWNFTYAMHWATSLFDLDFCWDFCWA